MQRSKRKRPHKINYKKEMEIGPGILLPKTEDGLFNLIADILNMYPHMRAGVLSDPHADADLLLHKLREEAVKWFPLDTVESLFSKAITKSNWSNDRWVADQCDRPEKVGGPFLRLPSPKTKQWHRKKKRRKNSPTARVKRRCVCCGERYMFSKHTLDTTPTKLYACRWCMQTFLRLKKQATRRKNRRALCKKRRHDREYQRARRTKEKLNDAQHTDV